MAENTTIAEPEEDYNKNPLETFQWVTEGILLLLLSAIGLFGNSCSVVTCARQRVQRIFHRLLLVLASFDTVSNILMDNNQFWVDFHPF